VDCSLLIHLTQPFVDAGMIRFNCKEAVQSRASAALRLVFQALTPSTLILQLFPWRIIPIRRRGTLVHILVHRIHISDNPSLSLGLQLLQAPRIPDSFKEPPIPMRISRISIRLREFRTSVIITTLQIQRLR
jgi:hypothetical protein